MNKLKHICILVALMTFSCNNQDKPKDISTPISKKKVNYKIKNNCGCETDSLKTENTINCDTTTLRNNTKLYYQFNCDSIWLTLENLNGKRKIIYSEKEKFDDYFAIQYRLAYKLKKEYDKYLLFRSDCPANGPCNFVLTDKKTGKLKKELGELIYDKDDQNFYDFILYFSKNDDSIIADFIDKGKQIKIPIDKTHFSAITPEYNFDKISYKNGVITLTYYYGDKNDKLKTILVDTKKYSHQHSIKPIKLRKLAIDDYKFKIEDVHFLL